MASETRRTNLLESLCNNSADIARISKNGDLKATTLLFLIHQLGVKFIKSIKLKDNFEYILMLRSSVNSPDLCKMPFSKIIDRRNFMCNCAPFRRFQGNFGWIKYDKINDLGSISSTVVALGIKFEKVGSMSLF